MRKLFVAAFSLTFSSFFLVTVTSAQDVAYHKTSPKTNAYTLLTDDFYAENNAPKTTVEANEKLQNSFHKMFENAANVNWYNVKKDYLAEFENNGRKTRALFGKNGYIYYAIAYGNEKSLSEADYRTIKSLYYNFEVVNVVEVYSKAVDYNTWLVLLRNDKNTVIARIIENGLDEYARFDNEPKPKKQKKGSIIIPKSN